MGLKDVLLVGIAGDDQNFLLSPHLLVNYARNRGFNLSVNFTINQYPLNVKITEVVNDIIKINPLVLAFAYYVWNKKMIHEIMHTLWKTDCYPFIVLGGPEVSREEIEKGKYDHSSVDFMVMGEGEKPFYDIINYYLSSHPYDKFPSNRIRSTAYHTGEKLRCNPEIQTPLRLEKIPSPYINGHVSDEILQRPGIRANFETQRGCNFRCTYCVCHKNMPSIVYRNPDMVIDEIEYVSQKGVTEGRIVDANFLSYKEHAVHILEGLIDREVKMSLVVEVLPQFVDEKIATLFGKYIQISPQNKIVAGVGLQSISRKVLKNIKRNIPLRRFSKALNLLHKNDVIVKSDIILGLPYETKETYYQTLNYVAEKMRHGSNYLSMAQLRILPGTELEQTLPKGYIIKDDLHFAYSTPTMSRLDMVNCLRMNTAAFRLFTTLDDPERKQIRDLYFQVHDIIQKQHTVFLEYLAWEFSLYFRIQNLHTNNPFVHPDFPGANAYYEEHIFEDIPHEWLEAKLMELGSIFS